MAFPAAGTKVSFMSIATLEITLTNEIYPEEDTKKAVSSQPAVKERWKTPF